MIAHRGASAERPENTHAAFTHALALGADGIELDLQLSRDGVVLVYHDRTLHKVGHGPRRIGELRADELRALDVGAWRGVTGERMPTLDEVLDRYGRRTTLLLEIKVEPDETTVRRRRLVAATCDAIAARDLAARVYVLSFDPAILAAVRRRERSLRCVLDVDDAPPPATLPAMLRDIDVVCPPARCVSARLGSAVRAAGCALWVYRCDTASAFVRARRAGATAMMSDRPDWLRAQIEAS